MKLRKSIRLKDYDYSQPGYYFVTICARDRKEWFGEIKNGEMVLNPCGEIATHHWLGIPSHFTGIILDAYVVMPNHMHGIIQIININPVGNRHACSLQYDHSIRRQNQKLPVVIGSFKSAVTKSIHKNTPNKNFQWQKSFHDHIIRNNKSLQEIRQYIAQNIQQDRNLRS